MASAMSRFEVEHALRVNLVVEHGVARRALLHELGEQPGVVGIVPFGVAARANIWSRIERPRQYGMIFSS